MDKAAVYYRYSSTNQDYNSIEAQKRAVEDYCRRNGITIVRVYIDEAESATTDDRTHFQEMMDDSAAELFDCVIVHKLDRFSRNRYDFAIYRKKLKQHNVRLISVLENFDDTPENIMLTAVLEGVAEYQSANLGREVKKGLKEVALKCQHTGGKPALGYDIVDKLYVINETEAEAVRIIFEMYADGYGYTSIIQALQNYKTKKGKPFGKNSIHDILRNERYMGVFFYQRSIKNADGSRNHRAKKPDIRIEDAIPAIIPKELYERVQERMNRNLHESHKAKEDYLLSGLIYCECGSAMCGGRIPPKKNGYTYSYYECMAHKQNKTCKAKRVKKDYVEKIVLDLLRKSVFSPEAIENITKRALEVLKEKNETVDKDIRHLESLISELDTKINNIVEFVVEGKGTPAMREKLESFEAQKIKYKTDIEELQKVQKITGFDETKIRKYVQKYDIEHTNLQNIKNILQAFVEKAVVYPDKIDLNLKLGYAWYLQSESVPILVDLRRKP